MGVGLTESRVAVRGVVGRVSVDLGRIARRASALHALAVGRGEPAMRSEITREILTPDAHLVGMFNDASTIDKSH